MSDSPSRGLFQTTHWTLVHLIKGDDGRKSEVALDQLCRSYHRPLYNFARSGGLSVHDAEDAVQDFFAHVLGNDALKTVEQQKGKLRSWMMRSFTNKLNQRRASQKAQKRGGGALHLCLDFALAEELYHQHHRHDRDPAHASDMTQALELWDATLARLDADPKVQKRPEIYAALRPNLLHGWPSTGPTQAEIGAQVGLTANALRVRLNNLITKARTIFGEVARAALDPVIPNEEVEHLWQLLK